MITDVAKGHVKAVMMQLFKNSGEHGVNIQRKPELKVYATKACAKGKLELASFSNTLHVVKSREKPPPNGMPRAGCLGYEAKGVGYTIFMKPTLVFPKQQTIRDTVAFATSSCIASFWAVRKTQKKSRANMQYVEQEVEITVLRETTKVRIAVLRNTEDVKADDELLAFDDQNGVDSEDEDEDDEDEESEAALPATKKRKAGPNTVAKGKGKRKGKGKAKGRGTR